VSSVLQPSRGWSLKARQILTRNSQAPSLNIVESSISPGHDHPITSKMADKEVNFFIVDLGQAMGEKYHGRKQTDLEYCLPIVWDKIGQIVATGRKLNQVAFMGLGTNGLATLINAMRSHG
jgi:hypothetical protein